MLKQEEETSLALWSFLQKNNNKKTDSNSLVRAENLSQQLGITRVKLSVDFLGQGMFTGETPGTVPG